MKCLSLLLAVTSCALVVRMGGYSAEAPAELCLNLIPEHSEGPIQSSKGGFEIVSNLSPSGSNGEYVTDGLYESTCYVIG